ncbi:hypothetical protein DH2020_010006 [Rehmannia glutinosa]|uniref:Cytochrome P450 protein n=1 Tax=Rehmannia glutinosa TaxID=99300 RepID=A0ABR0X7V7_REHGL
MLKFTRLKTATRPHVGKSVNMEDLLFATFTNIITNVLISRNVFDNGGEGESDVRVQNFLNELIEMVTTVGLTDLFPILERVDFWSKGIAMDIYHKINFIWGDLIMERRSRAITHDEIYSNSTKDFLDVLDGHGFPDDQIALVMTELLIAGTDSTTISSVWLMTELMKSQECLDKVRREIADKAVEGDTLNEELLLSRCPYFQACIKETLRCHIPGPLIVPHRAIDTCKVNNYTIPKDSIMLVNVWAIQMDPNNWEDATSFKPVRFLNSTYDFKGTNFDYLPFGAGQRMCHGSIAAHRGVQLVVAYLVHYFDWSLPNGKDPSKLDTSAKFGTTLKKDKPLYMIPRPRENYIVG